LRAFVARVIVTARGAVWMVPLTLAYLSRDCVVACDHITTIPAHALGKQIGLLLAPRVQ